MLQNSYEEDKDGDRAATPDETKDPQDQRNKSSASPTTPVLKNSKSKTALRLLSNQQVVSSVLIKEYHEPEFVID